MSPTLSSSTMSSRWQPRNYPAVFAQQSGSVADPWKEALDELLRMRTLQDDWDGEGTEAPAHALVDGAMSLAMSLQAGGVTPPDRVHVSVNSTIYLEWHSAQVYWEIEVESPVEAESRFLNKETQEMDVLKLHRLS